MRVAFRVRRLTGGPEVAPRVHSDLAGPAAGLREFPAERGGAGNEQSEEQEAAEPPRGPCPQGHGCARAAARSRAPGSGWSRRRPPSWLLNPRWGRSLPEAAPPSPWGTCPAPRVLPPGFGSGAPQPAARTPAPRGHRLRGRSDPSPPPSG